MEHEGSLPSLQELSTGPYPEPDQSNPSHPISLSFILILSTHLRLGLCTGLFPSGIPTHNFYAFLFSPFVLHVLPTSSSLTWSYYGFFRKQKEMHYIVIIYLCPSVCNLATSN
jgi:hypothetical protein